VFVTLCLLKSGAPSVHHPASRTSDRSVGSDTTRAVFAGCSESMFDLRQACLGDVVRMFGDRSFRQTFEIVDALSRTKALLINILALALVSPP
jgi:hypothetical protein